MEKAVKILSRAMCCAIASAAAVIGYFYTLLPGGISVQADAELSRGSFAGVTLRDTGGSLEYYLGAIPIKQAIAVPTERPVLVPCGTPFGIKLKTDGVMVISVSENSPAEKGGIKQGDIITAVNGTAVKSNSEISDAIQRCPEQSEIILRHGDSERRIVCCPENDGSGALKIGVWVRDSAAGIGTLTYYDPKSGRYGGLGHPVSDVTTGETMPLLSGEITAAQIFGVVKGEYGSAGELCGTLVQESTLGTIDRNTEVGVFGKLTQEAPEGEALPMAFRQEVHCGAAEVLVSIDSEAPRRYSIEIEKINLHDITGSKSMVIRITDSALLEMTGGIIRGMSGSPIIQDGMIAGAVTHVFLNDPARGYAVFCESMLDASETFG